MDNSRFIEYTLNEKGDIKLDVGGMNLKDRLYFIRHILFKGKFNIILRRDTVESIWNNLNWWQSNKESK